MAYGSSATPTPEPASGPVKQHYTARIEVSRTTTRPAVKGTLSAVADGSTKNSLTMAQLVIQADTFERLMSKVQSHVDLIANAGE